MSRVEENENMIQSTKRVFNGKPDSVLCQIKGQELGVLLDISKSLAVIADAVSVPEETDPIDDFYNKYGRKTNENPG